MACLFDQLQDSYALCRIFKKSLNAPKIINHYGITASDHSNSSNIEIYSCDDNMDNVSDHAMPFSPVYPPNNIVHGSSHNNIVGDTSNNDARWTQYLSEEAFSFTNPSFPDSCGAIAYPPSKVILTRVAKLTYTYTNTLYMYVT